MTGNIRLEIKEKDMEKYEIRGKNYIRILHQELKWPRLKFVQNMHLIS